MSAASCSTNGPILHAVGYPVKPGTEPPSARSADEVVSRAAARSTGRTLPPGADEPPHSLEVRPKRLSADVGDMTTPGAR